MPRRTYPAERLSWTRRALDAAVQSLAAVAGVAEGELARSPSLKELLERAAREGAVVLGSLGMPPPRPSLAKAAILLCRRSPGRISPMLADLRAGRRTEIGAIASPLLKAAKDNGLSVPTLSALSRWVRGLEREVAARKAGRRVAEGRPPLGRRSPATVAHKRSPHGS